MLCKIADADVETEVLSWQISSAGAGPVADRFGGQAQPPRGQPLRSPNSPSSGATPTPDAEQQIAALQQHIAGLDVQRMHEVNQAHQSGLEQGVRQARQEAAAEMESALDRLARAIQDVAQVKRRVRAEAENELVKLSLAIAQRILHRELTTDPQSLRGLVYAALQRLQNREVLKIRVFPAGVAAVRAALERNGNTSAIEIVADGLLQAGGLLFETAAGELDASVDTQLQEIERGFADRLQLR